MSQLSVNVVYIYLSIIFYFVNILNNTPITFSISIISHAYILFTFEQPYIRTEYKLFHSGYMPLVPLHCKKTYFTWEKLISSNYEMNRMIRFLISWHYARNAFVLFGSGQMPAYRRCFHPQARFLPWQNFSVWDANISVSQQYFVNVN